MNESDLEKELRALRPAPPPESLQKRLAAELSRSMRKTSADLCATWFDRVARGDRPWLPRLGWASLGAAATAVVFLFQMPSEPTRAAINRPVVSLHEAPTLSVKEWIAAEDEGLVFTETSEPQRRTRVMYLERHAWTNPETGAVIHYEVPREGLVLTPVSMQ
jgi:hypothetical protein